MYLLTLHFKTDKESNNIFNGLYSFYCKDYFKIDILIDILKFNFLKIMSVDCYTACTCKQTNQCKYCTINIHMNYNQSNIFDRQLRVQSESVYHSECKYDYIFYIDVFDSNQTGCEEEITFSNFNQLIDKYKKSFKENCTDFIPIFRYNILEIEKDMFYENHEDVIFYNSKDILWDKFITCVKDEESLIEMFYN